MTIAGCPVRGLACRPLFRVDRWLPCARAGVSSVVPCRSLVALCAGWRVVRRSVSIAGCPVRAGVSSVVPCRSLVALRAPTCGPLFRHESGGVCSGLSPFSRGTRPGEHRDGEAGSQGRRVCSSCGRVCSSCATALRRGTNGHRWWHQRAIRQPNATGRGSLAEPSARTAHAPARTAHATGAEPGSASGPAGVGADSMRTGRCRHARGPEPRGIDRPRRTDPLSWRAPTIQVTPIRSGPAGRTPGRPNS